MCVCHPAVSHSTDHSVSPLVSDHWLVSLSQRSSRLSPGRRRGGRLPAQAPGSQNVLTSFADNISKAGQLIAPTHPAHFTSLPHYFLIMDVKCIYRSAHFHNEWIITAGQKPCLYLAQCGQGGGLWGWRHRKLFTAKDKFPRHHNFTILSIPLLAARGAPQWPSCNCFYNKL